MKLTLNIDPLLINEIKEVARLKKTSLSKITEDLFKKKIAVEREPFQMKSLEDLAELSKKFSISGDPVPDFNHKAEYRKHLDEKYG